MGAFIVIALLAAAITKSITNYRLDREYARQGLDSPRYKVKLARLAAASQPLIVAVPVGGAPAGDGTLPGEPLAGAAAARPGAEGYFRTLWADAWEDATARHSRIRAEKQAGNRPKPGQRLKRFWKWACTPLGEQQDAVETQAQQNAEQTLQAASQDTKPEETSVPRVACPDCGETLTGNADDWRHPSGSTCPKTGKAWPAPPRRPTFPLRVVRPADPAEIATPAAGQKPKRLCVTCRFVQVTDADDGDVCEPCRREDKRQAVLKSIPPAFPTQPSLAPEAATSNEGAHMTNTTTATASDLLRYNQAVADHQQALAKLRAQLDQASALNTHLTEAASAVEGMDNARHEVATATTVLAEGLEQGRYGATSLEGAATSAELLTAGKVAATEEWIEAAQKQNQEWIAGLEVSIAGVEASLADIQAKYGEASATVQETGIDGRALEAD